MAEKIKHYGEEVIVQELLHNYEYELEKNGIKYTYLPIVEHRVIKYTYNNQTKYALKEVVTAPDEYIERIYITKKIPEDMSWENLMRDYKNQSWRKEKPMQIKTLARVLYDKACDIVYDIDKKERELNWLNFINYKPDPEYIEAALINLYGSPDMLIKTEHHDTPELDELYKTLNEKRNALNADKKENKL